LTLDNPLTDPNSTFSNNLNIADAVLTSFFTLELILKTIVMGFIINGDESYLRNPWNIMDFLIVCISITSLSITSLNLGIIKILRISRILRPLRMISRNQGLKITVTFLLNSAPEIGNVMVLCLLFLILFAILGTNFYKGTFFYC
jgi:hypothetical protein